MKRSEQDATRYAEQVVEVLDAEFNFDEITRRIVLDVVRSHRLRPTNGMEVILDNPASANWRLKTGRDDVTTLRVADYHFRSSPENGARAERINALLERI